MRVTGWRRLIGSPKLQIIFHKRATKYRALLRKMTYKDKGSYESSPPCRPVSMFRFFHVLIYTDMYRSLCMDFYRDIAINVYVLLDMYMYSCILSLAIAVFIQISTGLFAEISVEILLDMYIYCYM